MVSLSKRWNDRGEIYQNAMRFKGTPMVSLSTRWNDRGEIYHKCDEI